MCGFFKRNCLGLQEFLPLTQSPLVFVGFVVVYLFIFRERGREGERQGDKHQWLPLACPLLGTWSTTQACALTENRTSNPFVHRTVLNLLSHTSQGSTGFCSQKLWGLIFLVLEPCAGRSGVSLGLLAPKISLPNFYPPHVGEGPARSASAPLPV